MTKIEAERAGRDWADREIEALPGEPDGPWIGSYVEALPLVEHEEEDERRYLADVCNDAASVRWDAAVDRAQDGGPGSCLPA
jgi:hypothetical protein